MKPSARWIALIAVGLAAGSPAAAGTNALSVIGRTVTLQALPGGEYVCADANLEPAVLVADRDAASFWEQFEIVGADKNRVVIKAVVNGRFVGLDQDGEFLVADRGSPGEAQSFELLGATPDAVSLRLAAGGLFVSVDETTARLVAAPVPASAQSPLFECRIVPTLQERIAKYSSQKIVGLDIGETYDFTLRNGTRRSIKLVSAEERRDSVVGFTRSAAIGVEIDDRPLRLLCEPYVLPVEVAGIRIIADSTSQWGNVPKRVQFSIWDARDPIVNTNTFEFPINDYLLFSHEMQNYNEVLHASNRDGDPNGQLGFHDYGVDFGGLVGGQEIVSPVDARIIHIWPPGNTEGSVDFVDDDGLSWCVAHLDSMMPYIQVGARLKKGQTIGMLGKSFPWDTFPHLHIGAYLCEDDLRVDRRLARLNLYPWLFAASQAKNPRALFALARPHQVVSTGEPARFDGGKSTAFGSKIVSYEWTFHDGTTAKGATAEKTYDRPGLYMATLWVQDDKGNRDVDFCRTKVFTRGDREGSIPTLFVTHGPSMNVKVGMPVRFQCFLFGTEKRPITLDFGDGTVISDYASHSVVEHAFRSPGIHVVSASVVADGMPVTQNTKVLVAVR